MTATRDELRRLRLFMDLDDSELDELLPRWTEIEEPRGTRLMVHGSPGFGFMVILEGEAEVATPDGSTHRLTRGDFFGEMELLDHRGRSATVVSKTPMRLLALVEKDFKPMLMAHPQVAYRLLQTLSRRIRDAEAR
jgi:CRP-like cAMP-binding protein